MNNSKSTYDNTHCESTGKYVYTSESKARRAIGRYEEVKRAYYCHDCDGYHTTKISKKQARDLGIVPLPTKRSPSSSAIERRLEKLQNK